MCKDRQVGGRSSGTPCHDPNMQSEALLEKLLSSILARMNQRQWLRSDHILNTTSWTIALNKQGRALPGRTSANHKKSTQKCNDSCGAGVVHQWDRSSHSMEHYIRAVFSNCGVEGCGGVAPNGRQKSQVEQRTNSHFTETQPNELQNSRREGMQS